jgi:hypothetical protein
MEPCRSGLTYLFAKEAGFNRPRRFESSRFRNKIMSPTRIVLGDLFYRKPKGEKPRVRRSLWSDNDRAHPSGGRWSEIFYDPEFFEGEIQYPRE